MTLARLVLLVLLDPLVPTVNLESRGSLENQARKEMLDHQDLKGCPELTDLLGPLVLLD